MKGDIIDQAIDRYIGALRKMGKGVMPTETEIGPAGDAIRTELNRLRKIIEDMDAERERYIELEVQKRIVMEKARASKAVQDMNNAQTRVAKLEAVLQLITDSEHQVGDRVEKVAGDYTFTGTVRSVFPKRSGAVRIVVEMDKYGILFIAKPSDYRKLP